MRGTALEGKIVKRAGSDPSFEAWDLEWVMSTTPVSASLNKSLHLIAIEGALHNVK